MKLIRFGQPGDERPGLFTDENKIISVDHLISDYDQKFFEKDGIKQLESFNLKAAESIDAGEVRLGPPLASPSKIVCVGLNYTKHAIESGMDIPSAPVLFFKATSAITGPYDNIIIPKGSEKTDWEVELAIVIGKKANYISQQEAQQYIAGYMLHNDVSERAFQLEQGGQWVKGKSCDSFAPIGPYLVTKDEIKDPDNLNLWLKVNNKMMQNSNTSDLVFDVAYLVSYISQYMTLLPGDIISTGTPSGVGLGLNPPTYLQPGDVVELGIEGLGIARQEVIEYADL